MEVIHYFGAGLEFTTENYCVLQQTYSNKSYTTAVILSGIFGIVGIHHFYVERWWMGIFDFGLFLATVICLITGYYVAASILFFIDVVHTILVTYKLLIGEYLDGQGKPLPTPTQREKHN